MTVIERVCEQRLRKVFDINEMQMELIPGKGTVHAIFIIRQMR